LNQLYYLGKIIGEEIRCKYDGNRKVQFSARVSQEIRVDLQEFSCMLDPVDFQLIRLEPIIGGCNHLNLQYRRRGAFVEGYRYFQNLAEFFEVHQRFN